MSAFRQCIRFGFGCAESSATLCARHMQNYKADQIESSGAKGNKIVLAYRYWTLSEKRQGPSDWLSVRPAEWDLLSLARRLLPAQQSLIFGLAHLQTHTPMTNNVPRGDERFINTRWSSQAWLWHYWWDGGWKSVQTDRLELEPTWGRTEERFGGRRKSKETTEGGITVE